jgi:hypothetical protein
MPLNNETPAFVEMPKPTMGIFQEWAARARGETPVLTPVLPARFEVPLESVLSSGSEEFGSTEKPGEKPSLQPDTRGRQSIKTDLRLRSIEAHVQNEGEIKNLVYNEAKSLPNQSELDPSLIQQGMEIPVAVHESENLYPFNQAELSMASTGASLPQVNRVDEIAPWLDPSPFRDPILPSTQPGKNKPQVENSPGPSDANPTASSYDQVIWKTNGVVGKTNGVTEKSIAPTDDSAKKSREISMAQRMGELPGIRSSEPASPKLAPRHSQVTSESVVMPAPQIHIRIGRVDIRAVTQPAPSRPASPRPASPPLDLEGYLRSLDRSIR